MTKEDRKKLKTEEKKESPPDLEVIVADEIQTTESIG